MVTVGSFRDWPKTLSSSGWGAPLGYWGHGTACVRVARHEAAQPSARSRTTIELLLQIAHVTSVSSDIAGNSAVWRRTARPTATARRPQRWPGRTRTHFHSIRVRVIGRDRARSGGFRRCALALRAPVRRGRAERRRGGGACDPCNRAFGGKNLHRSLSLTEPHRTSCRTCVLCTDSS